MNSIKLCANVKSNVHIHWDEPRNCTFKCMFYSFNIYVHVNLCVFNHFVARYTANKNVVCGFHLVPRTRTIALGNADCDVSSSRKS